MAVSAAIMESRQGYPDTTLIEGVFLQDKGCIDGASQFDTTNSRSIVALGLLEGREQCVEFDPDHSVAMVYRNKVCRNGRAEYEEFQEHSPLPWIPKCMVVLLDATSRADLRDKLLEGGRSLVSPLRVTINYTTTLSEDPDMELASVNCVLGRELKTLYDYDRVGQEKTDELIRLKAEAATARNQFETFNKIYLGLSVYRPPTSPPPPALPPVGSNSPPAAPVQVSLGVRNEQLRDRFEALDVQVEVLAADIGLCTPSKDTICGRSSFSAPNPWISASGLPCAGNATREAIEGFYCGYWGSQVNPDAAESEVAAELLSEDGAPYCFNTEGKVLKCTINADRTNRAGIHELAVRIANSLFKQYTLYSTVLTFCFCVFACVLLTGMGTH